MSLLLTHTQVRFHSCFLFSCSGSSLWCHPLRGDPNHRRLAPTGPQPRVDRRWDQSHWVQKSVDQRQSIPSSPQVVWAQHPTTDFGNSSSGLERHWERADGGRDTRSGVSVCSSQNRRSGREIESTQSLNVWTRREVSRWPSEWGRRWWEWGRNLNLGYSSLAQHGLVIASITKRGMKLLIHSQLQWCNHWNLRMDK